MKRFRFERDAEKDRELDEPDEPEGSARIRGPSPGKVSRSSELGRMRAAHRHGSSVSPGKCAPSARIGRPAAQPVAVQHRRARAPGLDERDELAIAARGLADTGGPLPHIEELQRAFGRHDLTDIRAGTGDEAARANQRMGSVAYAMGEAIVFRDSSPDLFTVAHEVAHVIQQRAGAVATGTIGRAGDRHEAHADAVAERVVRGESAEDLLDQVAPDGSPNSAPSGPASVQRLDDEDYEGLSRFQAIFQALLDNDEDDALALMRSVDGAGEADLVLNSCQSLATRCLDDSEIAEAAGILVGQGGSLERALEWMVDEGTDWLALLDVISCASPGQRATLVTDAWRKQFVRILDGDEMAELVELFDMRLSAKLDWMYRAGTSWSAVKSKIVAAPAEERLALVTDEWRDWFCGDVVDNEEMSELVDLLGMPLVSKLDWLRAEGADYKAVFGKIAMAPTAERSAVYDSDLREFFATRCNDEEIAVVVTMLGGTLVQQLSWMAAEGCTADFVLDRVNAAPADQRIAIHDDSEVVAMIREFIPRDRVPIIEAVGGTPAQQMDLFGADSLIGLLTWATPSADWVDAIIAARESPLDLFEVAKGDPAGWGPLIQPKLWDLLEGHEETLYPQDRVAVFWAAYGSGSLFSADQILHFFKLVFGREIQPASEDITISTGLLTRTRFSVVAPTTATAQALMDCIKPGGGYPAGIGRAEMKTGTLAFCTEQHEEELGLTGWTTVNTEVLRTSCYWQGYVIIRAVGRDPDRLGVQPGVLDSNPIRAASDGTPNSVGIGLNYFQNHVRHEIGHAVGAKTFGSMSRSGNDFAREYGDWQVSSESEFLGAMWSGQGEPATGWPALSVGAATVTVTDDDVCDWCIAVISTGKEPNNALGNAPGSFTLKKGALGGSIWVREKLVWYLLSIPCATFPEVPATAFEFPGFTPPSPVPIFSSRWGNRFATYSTEAFNAFNHISWYARSSPVEMFAEMYTARYGGGVLPVATSGGDPDAFFRELEAQRDPTFGEPPPREPHLDGR